MSVKMNAIRKIKKVIADCFDGERKMIPSEVEFWRGYIYALREANLIDSFMFQDFMCDMDFIEVYEII